MDVHCLRNCIYRYWSIASYSFQVIKTIRPISPRTSPCRKISVGSENSPIDGHGCSGMAGKWINSSVWYSFPKIGLITINRHLQSLTSTCSTNTSDQASSFMSCSPVSWQRGSGKPMLCLGNELEMLHVFHICVQICWRVIHIHFTGIILGWSFFDGWISHDRSPLDYSNIFQVLLGKNPSSFNGKSDFPIISG